MEGGHCMNCMGRLERRPRMFHLRGRDFQGLVCIECNALWNDPEDSFFAAARELTPHTIDHRRQER